MAWRHDSTGRVNTYRGFGGYNEAEVERFGDMRYHCKIGALSRQEKRTDLRLCVWWVVDSRSFEFPRHPSVLLRDIFASTSGHDGSGDDCLVATSLNSTGTVPALHFRRYHLVGLLASLKFLCRLLPQYQPGS